MSQLRLLIIFCFLIAPSAHAFDIEYDATDPANIGTVLSIYGTAQQSAGASVPQRFKSCRSQATASGDATHFCIRICTSSTRSLPVGYAVYTDGGSGNPPSDTPLIKGYQASYTFNSGTGWYCFPFENDTTASITSGNYYPRTFMINANEVYADPEACRLDSPSAEKWFPDCGVNGATNDPCLYDSPPGVGTEPTYASANDRRDSASWQSAIISVEGETSGGPTSAVNISGSAISFGQ